jgi:hypothetical protein
MGFMERFKAKSRGNGGVATAELSPFDEMVVPHGAERSNAGASTVTLDMHASPTKNISTSIISEAAPSELAPRRWPPSVRPLCSRSDWPSR